MRALVHREYGAGLELREMEEPSLREGDVLVRVRAASVNPIDWHTYTGTPLLARAAFGLRRPRSGRLGFDFAGIVEAFGSAVADVRVGDAVYGGQQGSFAERLAVPAGHLAPKPANLSFEQAATVPVAGLTALRALRDIGAVRAGQEVLVLGASGGVGSFAVQIARAFGALVTGVCSAPNVELVRALGAQRVVDYAREDVTRSGRRFDLVLDIAGGTSWSDLVRVLAPRATVALIGGPKSNRWIGPLDHFAGLRLASLWSRRRARIVLATSNRADLTALAALIESGAVTPVLERTFDLEHAAEALACVGGGHGRGKVALTLP
jgi:NADPH:quinone reductase-like Zn-dependent oxidoreductase